MLFIIISVYINDIYLKKLVKEIFKILFPKLNMYDKESPQITLEATPNLT